MKKIIITASILLFLYVNGLLAQGGILDSAFGFNGKTSVDLGTPYDFGHAVALQADGKILVAGSSSFGLGANARINASGASIDSFNSGFDIVRFRYGGGLDYSFGRGGIVSVNTGTVSMASAANAVLTQSDGKILVAGYSFNGYNRDIAVVRLNINGAPDSTFGKNGITTVAEGPGDDVANAMLIQSDGKIVVAGYTNDGFKYVFTVLRFNQDGGLDQTFGNNGITITDLGGVSDFANACAIQPDGRIILAGIIAYNSTANDFVLARYNPDGNLDKSFGKQGMVITTFGQVNVDAAESVVLQDDGKIVVAGYANFQFAVTRYLSSGRLDRSFGKMGKVTTAIGIAGDYGYGAIIQPDGKIVVVGSTQQGSNTYFALVRYEKNGNPDSAFGSNGIVTTSFYGYSDYGRAIAMQPDGKIVAAGYASKLGPLSLLYYDYAAARYLSDLNLKQVDFTKEDNAVFIYPNPVNQHCSLQYSLDEDATVSLYLYDIDGKIAQAFFLNESRIKGTHSEQLELSPSLSSGNYVLVLSNGSASISIRIVKE